MIAEPRAYCMRSSGSASATGATGAWVAAGARDDTPPGVAKAQPVQPPARDRPAKDRGEVAKKRAELAKELRKLDQKIARGKRGAIKEREKILNKLRRLDREGGEARKQDDD